MTREESIRKREDMLAARRAWLDQRKKQFEEQYPLFSSRTNKGRLEDLEVWKFGIEIDAWELEQEKTNGA